MSLHTWGIEDGPGGSPLRRCPSLAPVAIVEHCSGRRSRRAIGSRTLTPQVSGRIPLAEGVVPFILADDRLLETSAATASSLLSTLVVSGPVPRSLDAEDLIDAQGVAELLGLSQRNTVSAYQRRYPEMPRPVIDLGKGRCKLWLGSDITQWRAQRLARVG